MSVDDGGIIIAAMLRAG